MIASSDLRDDLDKVLAKYNPQSHNLFVAQPKGDIKFYDPTERFYFSR